MNYFRMNEYLSYKTPFKYMKARGMIRDYSLLLNSFPKRNSFEKEGILSNNNRYDYNLSNIENSIDKISKHWLKFIDNVCDIRFFYELCDAFGMDKSKYKKLLKRSKTNITEEGSVLVDVQFCFNHKNNDEKSIFLRRPHVDNKDKLIVILLYFPETDECREEDHGELLLYETKKPYTQTYMDIRFMKDNLEIVDTISYDHNHGIIFQNGEYSVHAPKALINNKKNNRRFVNIVFINNC